MSNHFLQSQLLQAAILFIVIIALSYIVFPLLPISINYALVALIVGAFFLTELGVFGLYGVALLLWIKYLDVFSLELLFIGISAMATFFTIKLFVLRKSFFVSLLFLACFHVLFWLFFFEGRMFSSVYFYLEFLSTGALGLFLYGLHIWIQKTFH